jgi:ferrochelatase
MIAILLMAFGGPDSLQSIEPFLSNLMRGKKPSPDQVKKVQERYKLIGGKSPLLEITEEQARNLEQRLNGETKNYRVYVGMRYWHPYISEAVRKILHDGAERIAGLSLSPFSSRVTTSAYLKELQEALAETDRIPYVFIEGWYKHPRFIEALLERIREGMAHFADEEQAEVVLVFSAHSLPKEYILGGDSYVRDIGETISLVLEKLGKVNWRFGYQSRGAAAGEWLGPDVELLLEEIAHQGKRKVLLVPIGFASDHIETLYDVDIAMRQKAEVLGLTFHRAPSLNASPKFIETLAQLVEERVKNWEE